MMKLEVDKEFILEIYDVVNDIVREKIEEQFPYLFLEFKVGDWVYYELGRSDYLIKWPKKETDYAMGFVGKGLGKGWGRWLVSAREDCYRRKATPEEIEERLIQEAKKRGIWDVPILDVRGDKESREQYIFGYEPHGDTLWSDYGVVYENGKWATPLEVMPKDVSELVTKYGREKLTEILK